MSLQDFAFSSVLMWVAMVLLAVVFWNSVTRKSSSKSLPPTVPGGWPILGNLLQLTERKPHRTFASWSRKHGSVFHVKTGQINYAVINSSEAAKEVLVNNYTSISKRAMTTALGILTRQKCMVAMGDYGEEYVMLKKIVMTNLLGPTMQKANRHIRDDALNMMVDHLFELVNSSKSGIVDVRKAINYALFPFSMRQVFGYVPESLYVPGIGQLQKWDIFSSLVVDPLKSAIVMDWRDYFPALSWLPNKEVVEAVEKVARAKMLTTRALIAQQRKLLEKRNPTTAYCDFLLTQATYLTEKQLEQMAWEPIIESSDTSLVTIEWAMYELTRCPDVQERLYQEIQTVTGGNRMVAEEDIPHLKFLDAIVKETLRVYTPVPILPARLVEKDVKIAGYDIPAGWQVLVNQYAISMDTNVWKDAETWNPNRMMGTSVDMGFKDFRLLPFGGGKRMCAGVQQVMYVVPMNVACLVQHFRWLPASADPSETKTIEDTVYLTTHKLYPLKAFAIPRASHRMHALCKLYPQISE